MITVTTNESTPGFGSSFQRGDVSLHEQNEQSEVEVVGESDEEGDGARPDTTQCPDWAGIRRYSKGHTTQCSLSGR